MKKNISTRSYETCFNFIKYYPALMQVIILLNIFDCYYPFSITNWLYPIIGHSLACDLLVLAFSRMFRFCIWHRILIYSMIFNISIEWITVNFDIYAIYDTIMDVVVIMTLLSIISSIILRFKLGCTENERENPDGRAS